ncbi:MAG: MopE-related protein, partial [Saprospiraceae bacterium]
GNSYATTTSGEDCDDNNPDAYQEETWYQDSDSDGRHGDSGFYCGAPGADWSRMTVGNDCNDSNPDAYQNEMWFQDSDSDGRHGDFGFYCGAPGADWSQMTLGTDCNDSNPDLYATSNWFMDADGDGYHPQGLEAYNVCGSPGPNFIPSTMGYDCDDNNSDAHALENWYLDADGDGWFTNFMQSCGAPGAGWRRDDGLTGYGDCDDNNPGAAETTTYYLDSDADGWHTISAPFCYPPGDAEWVLSTNGPDDCDDSDANEFPGQTWYKDSDADGYSDGTTQTACERPAQHFLANELTAISGDCDDADAARFPGNPEICDGKDNNCDSTLPDDEADADMDGTATCAGDCDDNDPDPSSLDSAPPTAICQDITVTLGNDGTASRTAQAFDGGSSDGCTPTNQLVFSMPLADRQFDCSEIGTQTATLTVTDLGGNTASCSANVTVAVSCGLPFGTGFEGVGFTSATLTWPAFTCPAAQTMDIYLSTENTAPASTTAPTFAAQTGTSKNLTGLDCGTTYYAWFRTNCGTDVSDWHLSPVIFATTALNWPTVNPTTTTACLGDSVTLTAISQPGTVVAWYDAASGGNQIAIGSTLKVAPAQTTYYYAQAQVGGTLSEAPACFNPYRPQALVVVPIFASAYGPTYACEGNSATLTASGGTAYQWSTGENTSMINVSETGTYGVTITHTSGCTATRTLDFSVYPYATYYYDEDGDGFHRQTQTDCISPGTGWSTSTSGYDCD